MGYNAARAIAFGRGLPFIGVNHLEGHIYANWLVEGPEPEFPALCLVVSGGHTDLVFMSSHGHYERLGGTRDDAAGEAFDKVGRLLGLPFPGGPHVARAALEGGPSKLELPRPWMHGTADFSFSGLKTAVLHVVRKNAYPAPRSPGSSRKRSSTYWLARRRGWPANWAPVTCWWPVEWRPTPACAKNCSAAARCPSASLHRSSAPITAR